MRNIKKFDSFVNESMNIPTDPKLIAKEFDRSVKTMDEICSGIISAKDMHTKIKSMSKENPELSASFLKYFEMADKASKILLKVKTSGMSKETKKAAEQLRALIDMEEELKEAFGNMKELKERTKKAFEQNEGVLDVVGNFLRNILTGKFIVNLVKNTKQNLKDSYTDMHRVEDVFDIHDF